MYIMLALVMLVRGFVDAAMMRSQQAIALNSDGYLPPGHFDQIFSSHGTIMIFLHGDAVPVGSDQFDHAAADRFAGRGLSLHERGQPVALHGGRRARSHFAGDRQILHRGLDRLSAVFGFGNSRRASASTIDLGGAHIGFRLDHDGHQFPGDDHQVPRARHDDVPHAAPHLDRVHYLGSDNSRALRPDGRLRDARARPTLGMYPSSRTAWAET